MKFLLLLPALFLTSCAGMPVKWVFAYESDGDRFEVAVETTGKQPVRTSK